MATPLSLLWTGRATILEYQDEFNPDSGETTQTLTTLVDNEPCRLSHTRESLVNVETGAPYLTQTIVLFLRPDLEIKEGCVIKVTQNGYTGTYKRASKPSIYSSHQEVTLSLAEETA